MKKFIVIGSLLLALVMVTMPLSAGAGPGGGGGGAGVQDAAAAWQHGVGRVAVQRLMYCREVPPPGGAGSLLVYQPGVPMEGRIGVARHGTLSSTRKPAVES